MELFNLLYFKYCIIFYSLMKNVIKFQTKRSENKNIKPKMYLLKLDAKMHKAIKKIAKSESKTIKSLLLEPLIKKHNL